MIRQDPILITAPPRSGTTMLAGLIHYHGVWVGRSKTTRYPGTNSEFGSENIDIKNIFKTRATTHGYKNWTTPFPEFGICENLKEKVESYVPEDTPWLVKTGWCLIFWEFWVHNYPDALWVFPTREPLKIVDSMNRHPSMRNHPDGQKHLYISHLLQKANMVIDEAVDYTFVDIEGLADRNPEVVGDLFRFLDITPNDDVINDWIKPEMLKR